MSVHSQQIFVQASYQAAYAVPRSTRTPVMWGILGSTDKSHNCKIIFTLQRDSMLPLWFHNSNTFRNAGIPALTRPLQLEHASSPLPSAVRIFASFDLTSRKSYGFTLSHIFSDITPTQKIKIFSTGQTMTGLATTTPVGTCSDSLIVAGFVLCSDQHLLSFWSNNWSQMDLFVEAIQSYSFPGSLPHQVRLAPTPRLFVAPTLVITVSSNLSSNKVNIISGDIFFFWLVYAEFGAISTDSISVTFTYGSTTSAKTWNVLLRQISCTASYK